MTPDIGLANWFRQRALRTPERRALHFEGRDWTYGEMQREIEDCAGRLAALGVAKGDRVAFLGHNQPMFLFAMFACGAARRDLRAAQFPPHRARARLHDRGLRRERADRRRAPIAPSSSRSSPC